MIRYTLRCADGHDFESWFQSSEAFESLRDAGRLAYMSCGSTRVDRSLMAPDIRPGRKAPATARPDPSKALAALKRKVEDEADYVGKDFAREARAIHDGDAPDRPIYGEARPADARALIEDGVPVAPLPLVPTRKAN